MGKPEDSFSPDMAQLFLVFCRLLEDQLQKAEKDLKKRETDYTNEIHELQKENDKQQKIIAKVGIVKCYYISNSKTKISKREKPNIH